MAKITANGAHEVAKVKAHSRAGGEYLYVMCSDGRVLWRPTGESGSGYTVLYRGVKQERRNLATLQQIVTRVYSMTLAA
jgi:hypothetical protein